MRSGERGVATRLDPGRGLRRLEGAFRTEKVALEVMSKEKPMHRPVKYRLLR